MEEQEFLEWLRRHGAELRGVDWPSSETSSGARGAIATRDIESGDHMIQIPRALMMSESHAKDDPDLGHVHRLSPRVLDRDNGLAIYIMQEVLKREKSFYWPYLRVLPTPHNLRHWDGESLLLLQDSKLVKRVAARRRQLRAQYHETIEYLSTTYPEFYTAERYTFELFDFAWSTVQARAFGKRLKSSALVPFADCLNHGNVQTKYDFDVGRNGMFRLFPSGTNRYPRRAEVLNSYGRRANDNLLLEYGFAMLNNEWDAAEVVCSLPPRDQEQSLLDSRRKAFLRSSGQHTVRILRVRRDVWSAELLKFCRCACLTESELNNLEAEIAQRVTQPPQHGSPTDVSRRRCSSGSNGGCKLAPLAATAEATAEATAKACEGKVGCVPRCLGEEALRGQGKNGRCSGGGGGGGDRGLEGDSAAPHPPLSALGEAVPQGTQSNYPPLQVSPPTKPNHILVVQDGRETRGGEGGIKDGVETTKHEEGGTGEGGGEGHAATPEASSRFPDKPLSSRNELAALAMAVDFLIQAMDGFPTTLEHDEDHYREALAANDATPELVNALIYRVTIKRILALQLELAEVAIGHVQGLMQERSQPADENKNNADQDTRRSIVHAPPSSSRLNHLLPASSLEKPTVTSAKSSGCLQKNNGYDRQYSEATTGLPSFASYLSDLESARLFQTNSSSCSRSIGCKYRNGEET